MLAPRAVSQKRVVAYGAALDARTSTKSEVAWGEEAEAPPDPVGGDDRWAD